MPHSFSQFFIIAHEAQKNPILIKHTESPFREQRKN